MLYNVYYTEARADIFCDVWPFQNDRCYTDRCKSETVHRIRCIRRISVQRLVRCHYCLSLIQNLISFTFFVSIVFSIHQKKMIPSVMEWCIQRLNDQLPKVEWSTWQDDHAFISHRFHRNDDVYYLYWNLLITLHQFFWRWRKKRNRSLLTRRFWFSEHPYFFLLWLSSVKRNKIHSTSFLIRKILEWK